MPFNPKFSILSFPQKWEGNTLSVNFLILPRNFDPTQPIVSSGGIPVAPAYQTANLKLVAKVISGLSAFPSELITSTVFPLPTTGIPASAPDVFSTLAIQMHITDVDSAPKTDPNIFIKRYLPESYRNAFNFTNPSSKYAVTDDSYACAIRSGKSHPAFKPSDPKAVSWGQVFAYLLRQPDLARSVGFIQSVSITITDSLLKNGGWIYADLDSGSDYFVQQQAEQSFIKRYAARIPPLTADRDIFAAIQFPVLFKENAMAPDPEAPGNFDPIFVEASDYDTGFARIVHTYQPLNGNYINEAEDPDSLPRKDLGIRLGWDDEQLLIWQNRQLIEDSTKPGSNAPVDAPIGVSKYRIDVRRSVPEGDAMLPWISLAKVQAQSELILGSTSITADNTIFELGTEVYPSQIDGDQTANFWLPSYFTQWTGGSLVLPDNNSAIINNTGMPSQTLYKGTGLDDAGLYYGNSYDFRVRFADFTGGGPLSTDEPGPDDQGPAPISTLAFKRYITPDPVIWPDIPGNGTNFTGNTLKIKRPRLAYPAVVYTNKYADPVSLLLADVKDALSIPVSGADPKGKTGRDVGLSDPDVDRVEITVEVRSLLMDNQLSVTGRESWVVLYITHRSFAPANFDAELDIPIQYVDADVLKLGDPTDLLPLGLSPGEIDTMNAIILPTSRDIRVTMRAVCPADLNYFGSANSYNGLPLSFLTRQESASEVNLFVPMGKENELQGIYLQPDADPVALNDTTSTSILLGNLNTNNPPNLLQRLADQLGVDNKNFTLSGKPGQQMQFGCSHAIRHSLSPDSANITFSTKADLLNHWIIGLKLTINRDWSWDAMQPDSFLVRRIMKLTKDGPITGSDVYEDAGYIRLGTSANIISLKNPDRSNFQLLFLDAVDPKPALGKFPDTIQLMYEVVPQFKENPAADAPLTLPLVLPVTTNPTQIPELASAGIALSPYISSKDYSSTDSRERYLWLEFKEPPHDPDDSFFIRLLNYAPDPLLSKLSPELFTNTLEPALPIDPELIRVISSGNATDDQAGLSAMQPMKHAETSKAHFLIPLPPGLHAASPELFGMFTYEIRVGHSNIWSTAQGRYGRVLRTTGVQHPAPALFCSVNRDELEISVSAPHAVAVLNGVNITATPPRTEIWALLYAQVMQADGLSHRNILLDEIQLLNLQSHTINHLKVRTNKDAVTYSSNIWRNKEVQVMLSILGLPADSSLSVLCVEMMPRPETYLAMNLQLEEATLDEIPGLSASLREAFKKYLISEAGSAAYGPPTDTQDPLREGLGQYRILRTSPLTPVPFVCCT